jgi:hypothetical protein
MSGFGGVLSFVVKGGLEAASRVVDAMRIARIAPSFGGVEALAIPPNTGALRAIYVAPLVAIFGGAVALGVTVARWRARGARGKIALSEAAARAASGAPAARDEYDARLDEELKDLDG